MKDGDLVGIKGTAIQGRYKEYMGMYMVDAIGHPRFTLPLELIEAVAETLPPVAIVDTHGDTLHVEQFAGAAGAIVNLQTGDVVSHFLDRRSARDLITAVQAVIDATPEDSNG